MSTVISGTTSWLPALEFLKRNDPRTIADVVGDDGIRPYTNEDKTINKAQLALDPNLLAALAAASGQFEASVFAGERYSNDDLTLIAATDCNARAYMYDLISRIARMKCVERRLGQDPESRVPEWYKDTKEELQRIRDGQNIFGLKEVAEASHPKAVYMNEPDWQAVRTTVTIAKDLFGRRSKDFRRPGP